METLPVIAARQLAIGYSHGKNGSTVVHRDLSFDLWAGELTCLLGPNGAGKSTPVSYTHLTLPTNSYV